MDCNVKELFIRAYFRQKLGLDSSVLVTYNLQQYMASTKPVTTDLNFNTFKLCLPSCHNVVIIPDCDYLCWPTAYVLASMRNNCHCYNVDER